MIRQYTGCDIGSVMQIWLDTNIQAHHFISPDYWHANCHSVREMLPHAEIFVHEDDRTKQIDGFIGLNDNHIEGIFVKKFLMLFLFYQLVSVHTFLLLLLLYFLLDFLILLPNYLYLILHLLQRIVMPL